MALQCDVALEFADTTSATAIVSRSPPDLENGCLTLATLRWGKRLPMPQHCMGILRHRPLPRTLAPSHSPLV